MTRTTLLLVCLVVMAIGGTTWGHAQSPSRLERIRDAYLKELHDKNRREAASWVAGHFDTLGDVFTAGAAVADLLNQFEALDQRHDVDLSAANTPRVPSSCAESEGCGSCYEQAQRNLNRVRRTLEQLRVIGVQTKAMKDDAMAVGESFASFPGMGLGWYAARRDITTGWQGFVNAYNGKYRQLLESLSRALKEVGACEAEYFGQRDWYERFGFIYYEFIQDRYDPARILD